MQRYKLCIYFLIVGLSISLSGMQLPIDMPALCLLLNNATLFKKQLVQVRKLADGNETLSWQWTCMLGVAWSISRNDECKRLMIEEIDSISSPIWQKLLNLEDEQIPLNQFIVGLHATALTGNTVVLRALIDKRCIQRKIIGLIQYLGSIWLLLSLLRNNDLFVRILLQYGANKENAYRIINDQLQQLPPNFVTFLNITLLNYLPLPLAEFIRQLGPIDITILQKGT